jgi:filamentous hemagglutinin family protein
LKTKIIIKLYLIALLHHQFLGTLKKRDFCIKNLDFNNINFVLKITVILSIGIFSSVNAFAEKISSNTLPTGGNVLAGNAVISKTENSINVVQSSQRAVINWSSFNVGKNASVNFVQPNSNSATLNQVNSASASQINGAVNANGQVVFVNPDGVTFGKTAQVSAAGIVATTNTVSTQDFMDGNNTYSGSANSKAAVVNKGKLEANGVSGYVALLAPEVRNQGYIIAQGGANTAVALASGSSISLNFNGNQLVSVQVNASTYKSLIDNKKIVEAPGGMIIIAANSAAQLMGSVIKNSGSVSTTSMVSNGGTISIVADTVNNSGKIASNGLGDRGIGGNIAISGNNVILSGTSQLNAQGNTGGGDTIINAYRLDGSSAYLRVTDIVALGDDTNNRGSTIRLMTTNTSGVTQQELVLVRDLGTNILGGGTSLTCPTGGTGKYPDGPDIVTVCATVISSSGTNAINARISWTEAQA